MLTNLSIKNKKVIIILIIAALLIPLLFFLIVFFSSSNNGSSLELTPTDKPPLPTFPEAQGIENELIIQYGEGQDFNSLPIARQEEIMEILRSYGVTSQEKAYEEVTEGELSRSYLLIFSGDVNIEEIANKIYELPEIEGAQPNTQFGLF